MAETFRLLTAPGAPYEMETVTIRGVETRVYKRARPHMRQIFDDSRAFGAREFLIYEDERITFEAHWRAATALGHALRERFGVEKGDRVAVCLRNYPEWSVAAWASLAIGAILTPINAWGTADEIAHCMRDSGAKVLFADRERLERIAGVELAARIVAVRTKAPGAVALTDIIGPPSAYLDLPETPLPDPKLEPDDEATIFYTSGTTGRAKGALGTHRNLTTNLIHTTFRAARAAVRRGDAPPPLENRQVQRCQLLPVPLFHVTGFHSVLVPAMTNGAKLVLIYKWDPGQALALMERERVNSMTAVPSMYWQLLEHPDLASRDLSSVDTLGYGGAAPGAGLAERIKRHFPAVTVGQGYGATETSSVVASNSAEDQLAKPHSVGPACPACEVRVVAADGAVGELWVKGPNIVAGYWNNPGATAESFVDGWYATGDIVRLDEAGFIEVLDRSRDMIIRGGENIYCVEIEDVLRRHPGVLDVCVVGIPDRILGEQVAAVVRLRDTFRLDELEAHAARHLPPHKRPVVVRAASADFPVNAAGKTLKRALREQLIAELASAPEYSE